jgi:cytochrome c nitrite reductase small subunit
MGFPSAKDAGEDAAAPMRPSLRIPFLPLLVSLAIGLAAGLGVYTFLYAKGGSYLTDDPVACRNCHVMEGQYQGWIKSSHRAVAVCNDCHTPAGHIPKYATKALNGYRHSFAFTSGRFPEPIQITARDRRIADHACRKCHQDIVQAIDANHAPGRELDCLHCHQGVGHP